MNDSTSPPPSPARREDYEAIEAAVLETARGRWFLDEYARRHRVADTAVVLDAIGRLEQLVRRERSIPDIDNIRNNLTDMAGAIERTKKEIACLGRDSEAGGRITAATEELDAIIEQTETAASEILEAAEKIEDRVRDLRESGVDDGICDTLDATVTDVYMACSFQDLTGQRMQKVVGVLQYLESRIATMIDIWGIDDVEIEADDDVEPEDVRSDAHLLNGPQMPGEGNQQDDVDALFDADEAETVEVVDFSDFEFSDAPTETDEPAASADPEETSDPDDQLSEENRLQIMQNIVEAMPEDEIFAVDSNVHEDVLDDVWKEVATNATEIEDAGAAATFEQFEIEAGATEPAAATDPLSEDDGAPEDGDLDIFEPISASEMLDGETVENGSADELSAAASAPAPDFADDDELDAAEASSELGDIDDDPSGRLTAAERTALFS
ncbi:MAG: protein phosphatase CheZ [Hyphomicrobiales bacterium]|nr:protein phosphatase CheZ [Hyphomicrobiales bacterium]